MSYEVRSVNICDVYKLEKTVKSYESQETTFLNLKFVCTHVYIRIKRTITYKNQFLPLDLDIRVPGIDLF